MASPLQSFIYGEQAGLDTRSRNLDLENRAKLGRQQQTQFNQSQHLQGAQLLQGVVDRLKQVPDINQRFEIWNRVKPELESFGIDLPQSIKPENLTDEGLVPLETGLGTRIQQLTSNQRDAESRAQALVGTINPATQQPYTLQEARSDVARYSVGITPKAGSLTAPERIAASGTTQQVAGSQKVIKSAEARGSGEGKNVTDAIEGGFKKIGNIEANIRNIDRAISALDRGAKTGAVQRFLPSVTAASRELDQIRNELGLDVVGSVTFGALSEGELSLALDTALPTGLDEPELKDYLIRKKEAQRKIIDYLNDQIQFLEDGGTVGGWLAFKRRTATPGAQQSPSQQATQSGIVEWSDL